MLANAAAIVSFFMRLPEDGIQADPRRAHDERKL